MEVQTDITTYLKQGKQALGREAAITYAHGAPVEPDNPLVHLGLAEASLTRGSPHTMQMVCRKAQCPASEGFIYYLAQALLDLLDRLYEFALRQAERALKDDPGNAYSRSSYCTEIYALEAINCVDSLPQCVWAFCFLGLHAWEHRRGIVRVR